MGVIAQFICKSKVEMSSFTVKTRELDEKIQWRNRALARTLCRYLQYPSRHRRIHFQVETTTGYKDQKNGLEVPLHRRTESDSSYADKVLKPKSAVAMIRSNKRNQAQLQYGRNMDMLIAENEIKLSKLKTEQQV